MRINTTQRHHFWHILTGFAAALMLAMLFSTQAAAGCNKFGKGKDCIFNPNPTTPSVTVAGITDETPCDCTGSLQPECEAVTGLCQSGADISSASGDYYCDMEPNGSVWIVTRHMTIMYNKKYHEICHSMHEGAALIPNGGGEGFNYGWTDDCYDGSCAVEVRMSFSGPQVLDLTTGAAANMDLVLHGTLETSPEDNGNPFYLDRTMPIESIDVYFWEPEKGRSAGSCTIYPMGLQFWSDRQ